MTKDELKPLLEALFFSSQQALSEEMLMQVFEESGITKSEIRETIELLQKEWNEDPGRGLQLCEVAQGYQFRTKEMASPWIQKLSLPKALRLSPAALETLAIIAYRQPCIRSEIETIRGVDSGGVVKTLLERRLIRIIGRRDEAGQPLIYGTTREFLELFQLRDISELPALKDIEEMMNQRRVMTETSSPDIIENRDEETLEAAHEENAQMLPTLPELDEGEEEEALEALDKSLRELKELEKGLPLGELNSSAPAAAKEGENTSGESARRISQLAGDAGGQGENHESYQKSSSPPDDRTVH